MSSPVVDSDKNADPPFQGTQLEPEGDKASSTVEQSERSKGDEQWETDPVNARNWSARRKWLNVFIVALYTLSPTFASSMMAPGLPQIAAKYGITNPTVVALTLSIFLVTFAFAPLVSAPLSEIYGRLWVYHISNIFSAAFNFGCAFSPSTGSLLVFRALAGISGSTPVAIGGGSVADMFAPKDRAAAMAFYSMGPLIGPAIGPVIGGFVTQRVGVRYVFIVIAGLNCVSSLIALPFLSETYAPVIRLKRDQQNPDREKATIIDNRIPEGYTAAQYFKVNLTRPLYMLTRSSICLLLSLYMAFIFGIYYLMFSTFSIIFHRTYGFSSESGGLVFLGPGIGNLLALAVGGKTSEVIYRKLSERNGGVGTPEMRMPSMIFASLFPPIGLLWYGWSADQGIHWIMPIIGAGIFGFGMMSSFLPITLYLVDAFTYAASALSASSVLRSLFGFAFPLFAQDMFNTLGLGPGNTLLAGIALILGVPFPIFIYYKGAAIRARSDTSR
ncbi:major facilitator superfamily domain-containing protein [Mycena rebaudengoi]|nr:major facilitator superfamily domain-containing protein [Mycena rebaudengoi]